MKKQKKEKRQIKNKTLRRFVELFTDKRSYLRRLSIIAPVWLALCFTFLFFGPFELVAYSGDSLVYSFRDVAPVLAIFAGAVFVVGAPILPLIRGKLFNYVTTVMISIGSAAYLQAMFFNNKLGELNGDSVDYLQMRGDMLRSLLMWIGVLILLLFIMYLKRSFWRGLVTTLSVLITLSQVVPLVCIYTGKLGFDEKVRYPDHDHYLSCDGMFEYSEEHNVLVFVLDRLDYDYIMSVRHFHPDFFDRLDGFTDYTNAITTYARTMPALSHILSGYEDCIYDLGDDYYTKAWTDTGKNIFAELHDAGYRTDVYAEMNTMFGDDEFVGEYIGNANYGKVTVPKKALLSKMLKLSCYRYLPTALKPFFTHDTNYYNSDATVVPITAEEELYFVDESKYIEGFEGLSLAETDEESKDGELGAKCFKFYHFNGPHTPFYMNADGTRNDEGETDNVQQTMGSFSILYRIFDRMKELGIYEDSAIIITADHGRAMSDIDKLTKATRVGLFYKPSGSADTPLAESAAPISTFNIGATVLKEAGADYSAYGRAIDEVGEDESIVRTYYKTAVSLEPDEPNKLYIYDVIGDASKLENWLEKEVRDLPKDIY